MAQPMATEPKPRAAFEPLYDIHPRTGATIEVFYADHALETFGRDGSSWFWWSRRRGFLPDGSPTGPFPTSYGAYRNALAEHHGHTAHFGGQFGVRLGNTN